MNQSEKLKGLPAIPCGYPIIPTVYWIIFDAKSKVVKKIGYENYGSSISASGRHVLFYKDYRNEQALKVISLKDLIEGM